MPGGRPSLYDPAISSHMAEAEKLANRIGRAGMWHASQGARHGDCLDGAEVAAVIRGLLKIGRVCDER